MQGHRLFLLCSTVLLVHCGLGRCQTTPASTLSPTTATTTTTSTNAQGKAGRAASWGDNLANVMDGLFGALTKTPPGGNVSVALSDLVSRLPGMFGGQGGASANGGDLGQVLAGLFADPRTHNTPTWIDALLKGGNANASSQTMQTTAQPLLQTFSQLGTNQQLQMLLSQIFPNVLKGLGSLHLTPSSSPQEVISAILKDPSLMSSLSSVGRTMLSNLSSSEGLMDLLAAALKDEFPVDPKSQCASDLAAFAQGLQGKQLWAVLMLDAMGKLPAGILEGSSTLFGDFDECSSISYSNQSHSIEGLFCGMAVKAPDVFATFGQPVLGLHLCLPSSCNEYHRYRMVQPMLKSIGSQYYGQYCYRPRIPSDDDRFTGVVITFAILAALCALGTFYGVILDRKPTHDPPHQPAGSPPHASSHTNQAYSPDAAAEAAKNGGVVFISTSPVSSSSANGNAGSINDEKHALPPPPDDMTSVESAAGTTPTGHLSAPTPAQAPVKRGEDLPSKLLLSFSVLRNGRKVLACNQNSSDISCMHGIRVLSITWVILGHSFTELFNAQANRVSATPRLLEHFTYAVFPGAFFAVDTFFLLSGCLSAFLFLRATKKSGLTPSALILYYVHRIWRLTPLYALMLAYYIGIFPYTKRGPFENLEGMDSEDNCRKYWHNNILYVNNVVDDKMAKLCFGWSWYLSNDMQFSFLAPIVLIPWAFRGSLKRVGEVIGFLLAFALIIVHTVTSGVLSYNNDFSMFKNTVEYMDKVYFTPWCRVGPYAVGLLLGFILSKIPRSFKLSSSQKAGCVVGWVLACAVGMTLVYINYDNLGDLFHGIRWNTAQTAAYEALAKWIWAMCVAWVIFACYIGCGGFVNTLLSWSAWAPMSRLTYGVYLIHFVIISTLAGNLKTKAYMDGWFGTTLFLAVTVLSYLASFIFSMLIEAPTLGLEKAVLGKVLRKKN